MNQKLRIARLLIVAALLAALTASMCVPVFARASDYLSAYSGDTYQVGSTVYVSFTVSGTAKMEDIGALSIWVYESTDGENFSLCKTFLHESTSGMVGHNKSFHAGTVSFAGSASKTYKAYICVYAGRDGGSDSRWFWAY